MSIVATGRKSKKKRNQKEKGKRGSGREREKGNEEIYFPFTFPLGHVGTRSSLKKGKNY